MENWEKKIASMLLAVLCLLCPLTAYTQSQLKNPGSSPASIAQALVDQVVQPFAQAVPDDVFANEFVFYPTVLDESAPAQSEAYVFAREHPVETPPHAKVYSCLKADAIEYERLYVPAGLCASTDGTLYVADTMNDIIRVIHEDDDEMLGTPATGGSCYGECGGFMDGPADGVLFNKPADVCLSGDVLYICDTGNNAVRRFANGGVSTIAGGEEGYKNGLAREAAFSAPQSIAAGPDGTLYVSDTLNHCIRVIDAANNVSLFAGTPQRSGYQDGFLEMAQFFEPAGLCFGPDGALYIADAANHAIRRIKDGVVTTVAGRPGDEPDITGYTTGDFADGADARFNFPKDIAVLDDGAILVADSWNHCVRLIDGGETRTLLGNGRPGNSYENLDGFMLSRPSGLCVAGGYVFISDSLGHSVVKLPLAEALAAHSVKQAETAALEDFVVSGVIGTPRFSRAGGARLFSAYKGLAVREGDTVVTNSASSVTLQCGEKELVIGENSTIAFHELKNTGDAETTRLHIIEGIVQNSVSGAWWPGAVNEIETPTAIAGIRGTVFLIKYSRMWGDDRPCYTRVLVLDGTVAFFDRNTGVTSYVNAGEATTDEGNPCQIMPEDLTLSILSSGLLEAWASIPSGPANLSTASAPRAKRTSPPNDSVKLNDISEEDTEPVKRGVFVDPTATPIATPAPTPSFPITISLSLTTVLSPMAFVTPTLTFPPGYAGSTAGTWTLISPFPTLEVFIHPVTGVVTVDGTATSADNGFYTVIFTHTATGAVATATLEVAI